jgi:hypothetical protein
MTRRRKGKSGQSWQPEEVLAGKVEIGARALAELIQRVNPTDRSLPLAELTRRYRLKNQLQSLLVRRFGDEVEVGAEREGVALLAHRPSGKSACHARLAELDEDARSWVQRRLDEAAAPDPAAADTPARPAGRAPGRPADRPARASTAALSPGKLAARPPVVQSPDLRPDLPPGLPPDLPSHLPSHLSGEELLARGDEAMEAYDYELARHTYERALAASRGDLPAASALLGLLVEHLAAYDDAVALWPRLSPHAAGDGRVRTLVALAAAHVGEEARARELLRGLERASERESELVAAAEVYLVLARQALQRDADDGAAAARALGMARQLGGPTPDLLALERELGVHVARRCAPLEAQAQDAYDAGRTDEAEQRARDVLARWPESRAARALLSRIEAGRRRAQVDALLARADAAMEKQECAAAVGFLRQAQELDPGSDEIAPRLERAGAAARDQAAQAQVAEVEALFAEERLDAGLVAYLGLGDPQRARVRGSHPSSMLTWLEELGAPLAGARAHASAQAVLALARACAALARGDGHAAEAESAPHEKILRRLQTWRTVRQEAASAIARSQRERAQGQLAQAGALFDAGRDPAEIRALVDDIDARWLADQAGALEDLRARLAHAESRAQLAARIERALARGDLLDAREAAEVGLAQARDHERPGWQRQRDDLAARLRRAWCVQVVPGDGQRPMRDTLSLDTYHSIRSAQLTPDGARLLLAVSLRRWLFLRVVCTRSLRVEQYVALRTPAPLQITAVHIRDGVVTLIGRPGKLLQLAWGTWDVLAWRDLAAFVGANERLDSTLLIPGTPFVWLSATPPTSSMTQIVIDLERWCVHRSLPGPMYTPKRVGGPGALLFLDHITGRRGLHRADGTQEPAYRLPPRGLVDTVILHPRDRGLIVIDKTHRDGVTSLHARWLTSGGEELAALEIDATNHYECAYFGSDRDRGLVFLTVGRTHLGRDLLVLATDDGLRVHYRAPLPEGVWMFQDDSGAQRRIMARGPEGLVIVPIDGEPPRVPEAAPRVSRLELHCQLMCGAATPATDPHLLALRGSIFRMDKAELAQSLRALQRNRMVDARMWADVVSILSRCYQVDVVDEYIAWAQARFPEPADLALDAAQHHARMRRLPEALALLEAIEPGKLAPRRLRHLHHLRGVILFLTERHDDAHAAWTQGLACAEGEADECDLRSCIDLVAPVDLDAGDGEHGPMTSVGQIRRRVLRADRCLARGDVSGGLAIVDHEHVWQDREEQSFARLAAAYLASEERSPVHVFHQLLTLAALDAHAQPDPERFFSQRLPIPGAAWSNEELAALAERARVHLDEHAQRLSAEALDPA